MNNNIGKINTCTIEAKQEQLHVQLKHNKNSYMRNKRVAKRDVQYGRSKNRCAHNKGIVRTNACATKE
jgi:hypothetical protein